MGRREKKNGVSLEAVLKNSILGISGLAEVGRPGERLHVPTQKGRVVQKLRQEIKGPSHLRRRDQIPTGNRTQATLVRG